MQTIEIPNNIYTFLACTNKTEEIRRNAMMLYPFIANGTISHGRAADLLGISKWNLINLYGDEGLPYLDMTQEEADRDAENIRAVLRGNNG